MEPTHRPTPPDGEGAVLFADVTGSTGLYQVVGNELASKTVNKRLDGMKRAIERFDGVFVKASGDDVLCWFASASNALSAALQMLKPPSSRDLDVHAGLQWGGFVYRGNDIFGDCVNTAARLCALAKPKELLLGDACFDRLQPDEQATISRVSPLLLKGKRERTRLYSVQVAAVGHETRMPTMPGGGLPTPDVDATIRYGDHSWQIAEGESLTVGRDAEENTVHVSDPTVSRQHATISLANGQLEYADHSSAGSYVATPAGGEISVHRRTMVLSGSGTISLARRKATGTAPQLGFEVVNRQA